AKGDLDAQGVSVPGSGSIRRYDPARGQSETLVDKLDAPSALSVHDGVVLFATSGRGALIDIDPNDGKTELIATYTQNTGAIYQLDATGQRQLIADKQDSPVAVSQDSSRIYWLNRGLFRGSGTVQRSDGMSVASGLDFPGGMFVSDGAVFVAVTGA